MALHIYIHGWTRDAEIKHDPKNGQFSGSGGSGKMLGPKGAKEDIEAGKKYDEQPATIRARAKHAKENLAYYKSEYKRDPSREKQDRIKKAEADIEKAKNLK